MERSYELRATKKNPGPTDLILVEIRGARERVIGPNHHAYQKFIKDGGEADLMDYEAPDLPLTLDRNMARAQAVAEYMGEYHQVLARWDAFGESTKGDALEPWKAKVEARALELEG